MTRETPLHDVLFTCLNGLYVLKMPAVILGSCQSQVHYRPTVLERSTASLMTFEDLARTVDLCTSRPCYNGLGNIDQEALRGLFQAVRGSSD
jgi:hypothetical protein